MIFYLIIISVAYPILFLIDDKFIEAYYAIILSLFTSFIFLRKSFKSRHNFFSPVSLFVNLYNTYVIGGVVLWLYREIYFFNWDGDFFTVLRIYMITDLVINIWGLLQLERGRSKENLRVNLTELRLSPWTFVMMLGLEYVGIFLYTAGFTIVPLLQDDIDASRFELNSMERPGAGIGAILIYCGVFCIIHSFFCAKLFYNKLIFFIISYIPFLLYGGRLMMIIPLLLCVVLGTIKRRIVLNKIMLLRILFLVGGGLFVLMIYGAYRQNGESTDVETFLNYASADIFPEVRGSMAAFVLNKRDLTMPYISYMVSMMLPGRIASMIGITKSSQLSVGSYISGLLGYEGFGVRTSITGELTLTNPLAYILFWIGILLVLYHINKNYFNSKKWGSDKVVYLFMGIYYSTLIPYGITSSPNIIVMIIFMIVIKKFLFNKKKNDILSR